MQPSSKDPSEEEEARASKKRREEEDWICALEWQAIYDEEEKTRSQKEKEIKGPRMMSPSSLSSLSSLTGYGMIWTRGIPENMNEGCRTLWSLMHEEEPFMVKEGGAEKMDERDHGMVSMVQINFLIDLDWMMGFLPREKKMRMNILLVHGLRGDQKAVEQSWKKYKNVTSYRPSLPFSFGTHHTKAMILIYPHSVRIVIHTANMIQEDWTEKTQGIYVSPFCFLKEGSVNHSDVNEGLECEFERNLVDYIHAYGDQLKNVKQTLMKYDYRSCKGKLIGSIPGRHREQEKEKWGWCKLKKVLGEIELSKEIMEESDIICQVSSIGSLGINENDWFQSQWKDTLLHCKNKEKSEARFNLVFPTVLNVQNSLEGYSAGGSLHLNSQTYTKQRYIDRHLKQWKADHTGRTKAMPHLKSYMRIARKHNNLIGWWMISSANLSKAAWGSLEKKGMPSEQLFIRSYELGILFHPDLLQSSNSERIHFIYGDKPYEYETKTDHQRYIHLPIPYDYPLQSYANNDQIWLTDLSYNEPDSHGRCWMTH